jgi:small subunit ribosomal protein S20
MPNTKSAERRMRNSARKKLQNRGVKTRLHNLEKNFRTLATAGKKTEAGDALKALVSAFDKAAKSGVVHRGTADRKKSRLTVQLNRLAKAA